MSFSHNQSSTSNNNMNDSRNTSRRSSLLFSHPNLDDSMASRQSRENSLISTQRYKSPFYEGKVSFGGSSAKRVRLSQTIPYSLTNKPSTITRIKESDIKRSTEFDQLSNATKSMLENIYKASSPLEDAKKIPVYNSSFPHKTENFMIDIHNRPFKRLSSLRTPKFLSNLKTASPLDRDKLQLKWEDLENSSTQSLGNTSLSFSNQKRDSIENRIANASSFHSHHHSDDAQFEPHAGGKMLTRNTRSTHRSTKPWSTLDDDNVAPQYDLPNIPLPFNSNSLPTFNLSGQTTSTSHSQHQSHHRSNVHSLKRPLVSITVEDDNSCEFKFSAPKAIKLEKISDSFLKHSIRPDLLSMPSKTSSTSTATSTSTTITTTSDCNRTSVDRSSEEQQEKKANITPVVITTTTTTTSSLNTPTKPPASTDASEVLSLETNKTVEMYKLDKLESDFNPKENKATLANTNLPIKSSVDTKLSNAFNCDGLSDFAKSNFLPSNKKWTCDTCAVKNELTANKCIACEQPRLKEVKDKNVNSIYSNYSFGTINLEKRGFNAFKPDCKIQTQPNPVTPILPTTTTTNTTTTPSSIVSSVTSDVSSPASSNPIKIEPSTNSTIINKSLTTSTIESTTTSKSDSSVEKVVEQTNKPFEFITNEIADKIDNSKTIKSNWDTKFLAPKTNWNCPGCYTSNKSDIAKCPCCETPNPSLPKEANSSDSSKVNTSITFGSSSTGGFNFNLTPTVATTSDDKKSESKPVFSFGAKTSSSAPMTGGFTFGNVTASTTNSTSSNDNQTSKNTTFSFGLTAPLASSTPPIAVTTSQTTLTNKPLTIESNDSKSSSLFSSTATLSFSFGQPSKEIGSTVAATQTPAFVFGSSSIGVSSTPAIAPSTTNSLNNGPLSFNLSSTAKVAPSANASLFSNLAPVNNSNLSNSTSMFNASSFSSKPQFGQLSAPANQTVPTSNMFNPPSTMTNGFGRTTVPDNPAPTTNLFGSTNLQVNNQTAAPALNFSAPSFNAVPSFNFGAPAANQSGSQNNSNVFQFSAVGKSDAPLGQSQMMMNSTHGRFIKKAKRRLGSSKDN